MGERPRQLLIPPDAEAAPDSVEMVRDWIVDGGLQCSLEMGIREDFRARGILLADILRYVADAREKQGGVDTSESIRRIRSAFDAELDSPTCETEGDDVA